MLLEGGSTGFDAKLGGWYYVASRQSATFRSLDKVGLYWTSTTASQEGIAYSLVLTTRLGRSAKVLAQDIHSLQSVRCVKDY